MTNDRIIYGGEIGSFETNEFGIPIPETFKDFKPINYRDIEYIPAVNMSAHKLYRLFDPTLDVKEEDTVGELPEDYLPNILDKLSDEKKKEFEEAFDKFNEMLEFDFTLK